MTDSKPVYSPWRHGGWYVDNVRYPSRACGCVSNNYPDKRWRIVCVESLQGVTFDSRDSAARAERAYVEGLADGAPALADTLRYLLTDMNAEPGEYPRWKDKISAALKAAGVAP